MKSWDIFCSAVDNYGDVGVSWRLARQLAHEFELDVRLFVDDLQVLERLC
ncbi:MAG: elongation factor P maturation arginine rhamnosyltransferase EarP, partial [Gammaproteobacteria bacterium]|nr:elongation factor P maturation arginine rhamnosyltransferase EarP [Gammaproteobacteria bacterium]